jgi:cyclophilin family peptidyl-prolyl cis-trans isomerase
MKSLAVQARWIALVIPVALVAVAVGCGGGGEKATSTPDITAGPGQVIIHSTVISVTATPSPPLSTLLPARTSDFVSLCQKSNEKVFTAPQTVIDPSRSYTATIRTEKGDITVDLFPGIAPVTVNSFVFLACKGFYDGVTFHRVIPNSSPFVAQTGDPTGTGTGGPGYRIPDEFSSQPFEMGTLGMANTGAPDSGGSQFFICYVDLPNLNGGYTAFGKVTTGMDVVDKLTPRNPSTDPNAPPGDKILEITVQEH